MSHMQTVSIADAVLDRGRYSWVWVVPECPYCKKEHEHYAGTLDNDPYMYLGQPVTSKCDKTDRCRLSPDAPNTILEYVLKAKQPN